MNLFAGSLIKNGLQLGKGKSVESTFSAFIVFKYAVSSILKKIKYLECFNPCQLRFVFVYLFELVIFKKTDKIAF